MTADSAAADVRSVLAVSVVADSALGQAAQQINTLTMHLPTPQRPDICPTCAGRPWPCRDFHEAAQRVYQQQIRLIDLVPAALHPILWPSTDSVGPPRWPGHVAGEPHTGRRHG